MVSDNKTGPGAAQPESAAPEADPLIQRCLSDRFTILEAIGAGGMGRVYKAMQTPLDRVVAIKVLNSSYANAQDPGFRQRFFLEASLTAKLRHSNTITVIDYGQTPDGIFYIAMEYLEGQPLSQVLARSGAFHWTRCLQIAQQICRSLREAHKLGIIHRDLKPANVMLLTEDREDRVKVLDFGLVKSFIRDGGSSNSQVTNAGMFLGSPQYMAPEQARNHADPRSDIYSLGVLLYQMLAGQPPFTAKDTIDIIFKHMNDPPPPIRSLRPDVELPKEVEALVMKCLEKQPSWRFQSMEDVLEAIRKAATAAGMVGILSEGGSQASPNTPPPLHTPAMAALGGEAKEATLAIDINVIAPAGTVLALMRDRRVVIGAIAVSLLLVASSIALVLGRGHANRKELPAAPQVQKPTASEAPAAEPKIRVEEPPALVERHVSKFVKFRVSTDPEGARVSMGGRTLGSTPTAFNVPARADGTASAELLLTLKGYHPLTVVTGGSGPEVVLTQRLQSKSSGKPANTVIDRREAPGKAPSETEKPEEKREEEPQPVAKAPPPDRGPTPAPTTPAAVAAASQPEPASRLELDESKVQLTKISGPDPQYTTKALEREVEGVMMVKCILTVEGAVHSCRVLKGLPFMDRAVVDALERRRYQPYLLNGAPTEIEFTFKIRLKMPQ